MRESLKQLREKLDAKRTRVSELFKHKAPGDDGKKVPDFQAVDAEWLGEDVLNLKGTEKTLRICEIVEKETAELDVLCDQVVKLEKAHQAAEEYEKTRKTPVNRPGQPDGQKAEQKTFGQIVTEDPLFKKWQGGSMSGQLAIPDMGLSELKTLFQTSAGWAPESTRTGFVAEKVTRPLQVIDIIPSGRTGMAQVVYMREDTRTHAAAETAEAGAYPESEFVLSEQSSTVRKIADSVPVTDEQLEDVPMAESYLEDRLPFGVMQRLDQQVISGDGIAPNLDGIVNVGGIQTQAKGADPVPDAVYKAMTLVGVTGRAMPTHFVTHPNDWQEVRLLRTADGIYIWGSPSEAGPERIWGLPVVKNESLTEGTGLVGSFLALYIQLVERRGVVVEMGFVDDDFTKGRKTLRASGRWALPVYRPAAFCTVTGI